MKPDVILATGNRHKLREIRRIFSGADFRIRSLADFPPLRDIQENGATLEANAAKKANAVSRALGLPALADDSGLFVPALGGSPGVRSARYAGPARNYNENNHKLLGRMRNLRGRRRRAYFATAVALARPGRKTVLRSAKIWGSIVLEPSGKNGFGYDPLFRPRGEPRTFAQMTLGEKNRMSHRARAFKKMLGYLRRIKLENS